MTTAPMKPRERVFYVALGVVVILTSAILYWFSVHNRDQKDAAQERAKTAEQYIGLIDADCNGASGTALADALNNQGRCGAAEKITDKAKTEPIPGPPGPAGQSGTDGQDGQDGKPGKTGKPGRDGTDGQDGAVGPVGPIGPAGAPGADGKDGATPDLSGYATEEWVRALIAALGCSVSAGEHGPPLVFTCSITGKP